MMTMSRIGKAGVTESLNRVTIPAEAALAFTHILIVASRVVSAGSVRGQPDRRLRAQVRGFMPAEPKIVAELRVHLSRVTGIDRDPLRLQLVGKGHRQHSVGLFGLTVRGPVVIETPFKFEIINVQVACPVAGDIYDASVWRQA